MEYRKGAEPKYLLDPEFERANALIRDAYRPATKVALLTVCSWAKPYSQSYIHYEIRSALYREGLLDQVDYIHVSNAGVVPHEAETWYPFTAYDWNNHGVNDPMLFLALRQTIQRHLIAFLSKFKPHWDVVVPYFRLGSNTHQAMLGVIEAMPMAGSTPFLGSPDVGRWNAVWAEPDVPKDMAEMYTELVGYVDPDLALVRGENLTSLVTTLKGACK